MQKFLSALQKLFLLPLNFANNRASSHWCQKASLELVEHGGGKASLELAEQRIVLNMDVYRACESYVVHNWERAFMM